MARRSSGKLKLQGCGRWGFSRASLLPLPSQVLVPDVDRQYLFNGRRLGVPLPKQEQSSLEVWTERASRAEKGEERAGQNVQKITRPYSKWRSPKGM